MNFSKDTYKIYTWKHWMMIHWILNPGLAINELVLGQRIPKVSLEDKTSDKPRIERNFVPCPHCNTLHDSRTWSTHNGTAFKNWFGLYCNSCGGIIPCLLNVWSALILAVTFPIWGWFKGRLKAAWLAKQPERYKDIDVNTTPNIFDKKHWIKTGMSWGALMFVIMSVLFPLIFGEEITLKTIAIGVVVWTIGGLGFGFFMKMYTKNVLTK